MLDNNTDDHVNLRGKHMRFLKDRECNKSGNHSTQGDCRAKAPINISESSVQVGRHTEPARGFRISFTYTFSCLEVNWQSKDRFFPLRQWT